MMVQLYWKQRKDGIVFLVFVAHAGAGAIDSVEVVFVRQSNLVLGETSDTGEMVTMDSSGTDLGTQGSEPVIDTVVAGSH
jgi:flagellar biogenesis protein FliO